MLPNNSFILKPFLQRYFPIGSVKEFTNLIWIIRHFNFYTKIFRYRGRKYKFFRNMHCKALVIYTTKEVPSFDNKRFIPRILIEIEIHVSLDITLWSCGLVACKKKGVEFSPLVRSISN